MGVTALSAEVSDQIPLVGLLLSAPLMGRRRRFAELGAGDAVEECVGDAGSAGTLVILTVSAAAAVCGAWGRKDGSTFTNRTCGASETATTGVAVAVPAALGFGRRRFVMRSFSSATGADDADDTATGESDASACVAYVDLTWRRERRVLCWWSGVVGAVAAEEGSDASSPPLSTRTAAAAVAASSVDAAGAGDVSSRLEERRGAVVASPAASSAMLEGGLFMFFVNWHHFRDQKKQAIF